jgi:hypothetical protein
MTAANDDDIEFRHGLALYAATWMESKQRRRFT